MEKYRKSDIETSNIDLIILKLFENEIILKQQKKKIKRKAILIFFPLLIKISSIKLLIN